MSEKIQIKNVRVSYLTVFKARAMEEGQTPKFSTQLIIPKDHPQIKAIREAIFKVAKEGFPKLITGTKIPSKLKTPLRDGDDEMEGEEAYENAYFFNASNLRRPVTINRDRSPIADEDDILYSGCYCNVIVEFYHFDKAGNKGIAASLGGVQFVRDGEALGGRGATADDFDEVEVDEDEYADLV